MNRQLKPATHQTILWPNFSVVSRANLAKFFICQLSQANRTCSILIGRHIGSAVLLCYYQPIKIGQCVIKNWSTYLSAITCFKVVWQLSWLFYQPIIVLCVTGLSRPCHVHFLSYRIVHFVWSATTAIRSTCTWHIAFACLIMMSNITYNHLLNTYKHEK